jgi:ABC-type bacteriocin/lantibiotic exporter with double-glycine peptidase domain
MKELKAACSLIAKKRGISFDYPKESDDEESFFNALSLSSGVPIRKVILEESFWENTPLPLIAFSGANKKAVAVLPLSFGKCAVLDPVTKEKLNASKFTFQSTGYSFYLPEKKKGLYLPLVLSCMAALFSLLPLFAIQWIFNHGLEEKDRSALWQFSSVIMALGVSAAFFLYLRNTLLLYLSGLERNEKEPLAWKKLFGLHSSFFRKEEEEKLYQKLSSLSFSMDTALFLSSLFSFLYFVSMFLFSPLYALISIPFLALLAAASFFLLRYESRLRKKAKKTQESMTSLISESLISIKRVRASNLEKVFYERGMKELNLHWNFEEARQRTRSHLKILHWFFPFFLLGIFFIPLVYDWRVPPTGNFFAFYLSLFYLCFAIRDFIQSLPQDEGSDCSFEGEKEKGGKDPGKLKGAIDIENISFRYDPKAPLILDSVSLKIAPKEKIGIFGPSGSGKTTLIRLLLGLETPSSGEILLDGHKLASFDPKLVRKQIGTVFRTEGIIAATLYENIDLGRRCPMVDLEKAIDFAGFREDIESFSMGFNTLLPEGGDVLSSGQKQRLLITRALAHTHSILLFDQAMESLDPISQEELLSRLKEHPVTQIYVSHDLEFLEKITDRIYELDAGKLSLKN